MDEMMKKKRQRSKNFSVGETEMLKEMVLSNSACLFAKHCNGVSGVTKKQQDLLWLSICKAVNAVGVCDRSIEDVKEKWRNLTKKAKTEFTAQRVSMMKMGGGPPPPTT